MIYNIISTGSKGNAVVINKNILIDCGVPFKSLINVYKDIDIVLLTHIHSDHFKKTTIKRLLKERPTLRWACCDWLMKDLLGLGAKTQYVDVLEIGKKYDYGGFKISPVKLYHNAPNCGYRLYLPDKKILYATDTNSLEGITAKNYDLYMLECNYEDEELQQRILNKELKGEYAYEHQVVHNHLSKTKCDDFIIENAGPESEFVYLHQHIERGDRSG